MTISAAVPSQLIEFSGWAKQQDRDILAVARKINHAIEGFNAMPQNPHYIGPLPYVGDDLASLSAGMSAVDEWVGRVGHAFEQAGNQGTGASSSDGWSSIHDATLTAAVTGPSAPPSPAPSAPSPSPQASSGHNDHNGSDQSQRPSPPKPPTSAQWFEWGLGLTFFVIGAGLTVVSGAYFLSADTEASSASDMLGLLKGGDSVKGGTVYGVSSVALMIIGLYLMTPVNSYSGHWYETNAPNMPENPGA